MYSVSRYLKVGWQAAASHRHLPPLCSILQKAKVQAKEVTVVFHFSELLYIYIYTSIIFIYLIIIIVVIYV